MKSTQDSTQETQGRVECVWYERSSFDKGRITFNRLKLTNDDVRSMFSIFCQRNMFPQIDMYDTLLRSRENIFKSFILPEDYVQVASLLCSAFISLEFKFNSCQFAEYVGIKVSYTQCSDLQENTTCILPNQLYMFSHRISLYKMSVTDGNALLRCRFVFDHAPLSIETCQLTEQQV